MLLVVICVWDCLGGHTGSQKNASRASLSSETRHNVDPQTIVMQFLPNP
jgi:hypothetical protein